MDELNQKSEEAKETAGGVEVQQEEEILQTENENCPETDAEGAKKQEDICNDTCTDNQVIEEIKSEVLRLEEEKKSLFDRLSRLQADFNNYRRRVEQEKEELRERSHADLLLALLPIIDNFERAISNETTGDSFVKGVEMIYRQLLNLLEKEGVSVIEAEGEMLDPELHYAVMKEAGPEGVAEDTIIEVIQKGYLFKERVLRPAMVKVAE